MLIGCVTQGDVEGRSPRWTIHVAGSTPETALATLPPVPADVVYSTSQSATENGGSTSAEDRPRHERNLSSRRVSCNVNLRNGEQSQLPLRHQHRLSRIPAEPPTEQVNLVEKRSTLIASDWRSPNDQGNPNNWSLSSRIFHTAIPAFNGFVCVLATSAYVPAVPYIQAEFQVSQLVAILGFSLYTLGVMLGSTLGGPLSELFGRRLIYLICLPLFGAFTAGAGAATNIETLLICRTLAGVGGSLCLAVGGGTVADLWDMQKSGGTASLLFVLMPFLGPTLGPLVGACVIETHDNDWRWSMWVVLAVAAPIYVAGVFMKETSKKKILKSRQQLLSYDGKSPGMSVGTLVWISITRTIHMLLTEPLVYSLAIYTSFAFAIIFVFFDAFPVIFQTIYGFDDKEVGMAFLSLLVGFLIAIINYAIFDKVLYAKAAKRALGRPAAEYRLYSALVGSLLLPISQFWFALTSKPQCHWIVPIISCVIFGWASLNIFLSTITYLLDAYHPSCAASAIAALGVLRYLFGAIFPLFALQMYESLGIQWAGLVFAFVSLALAPVPWIFFKWGKSLRAKSKYETNKE